MNPPKKSKRNIEINKTLNDKEYLLFKPKWSHPNGFWVF